MIRAIGILLLFGMVTLGARAQQDAQFTQYMFNPLYFNPSFAGLANANTLTAIHRSQWFGYQGTINQQGAPNTQMISYNTLSDFWDGGMGIHVVNDQLGPSSNLEIQLSGSYFINLPGNSSLSIGLKLGMFSSSLDFDELVLVDPGDNIANISGKESQIRPDVGLGFLYRNGNFFGGFSTNHLLQPKFDFGVDEVSNQLVRHYYLTAGYDYALTSDITLTPTFLIKNVGFDNYSFDVSVMGKYKDQLWAGLSYRNAESASVLLGYSLLKDRSLAIAYAIDVIINERTSKEPTSQEFMVIYKFLGRDKGKNLGKNIIRTPRYRY